MTDSTSSDAFPLSPALRAVLAQTAAFMDSARVSAYVVGGAVRDHLLERETRDIDLAIAESPHRIGPELAALVGGRGISLDERRDMFRIVIHEPSRITVDICHLVGGSIIADLRRRDFTIDAMAVTLSSTLCGEWNPIDPTGGAADLTAGAVRAVNDSVFSDDPVRLLRAVRLGAQIGAQIEPHTESMIRRDARLLASTSSERAREEFLRILAAPNAGRHVRLLDSLGLLRVLIPELEHTRGVEQPKEHYYDVFGHLLACVEFADAIVTNRFESPIVAESMPRFDDQDARFEEEISDGHARGTFLKLTALLHDIAKPQTRTVEPSGRMRFFGHSEEGGRMSDDILTRLRIGKRGARHVASMIRHHLRPREMARKGEMPTHRAIHRYFRDLDDFALDTLCLNMADFLAARGPLLTRAEMKEHAELLAYIQAVGPQRPVSATRNTGLLDGHDIMKELNMQPGPSVGRLLELVAEAEAQGLVNTKSQALAFAKSNMAAGGNRA